MNHYEPFVSPDRLRASIEALHASPAMVVLAATGVGSGLQDLLWEVGGASRTIVDAQFPYSHDALADFLGGPVERTANAETAFRMAAAAYDRARLLQRTATQNGRPPAVPQPFHIGLGVTGAVATTRERRGDDRVHIAVRTAHGFRSLEHTFDKGDLDRAHQGLVVNLLGLRALLQAAGLPDLPKVAPTVRTEPWKPADILKADFFPQPLFLPDGQRATVDFLKPETHILFPGSYDPLHDGHQLMARTVERQTGKQVVFCITTTHPVKGDLSYREVIARQRQFAWRHPVLFTQGDGLYVEKAERFPGFSFLVGVDVVRAIFNPRHYGDSSIQMDAELRKFRQFGTRFYVAGRKDPQSGAFETLDDVNIPPWISNLFIPVQARLDLSSTELRAAATP